MTGLFLEDRQSSYLDEPEDRYQEMLASSRAFVINQFGLSAFVWEDGGYRAKTFNYYIFPRPFEGADKRFVCQASSMAFLASCGFDFNKAIYDGVGYMTVVSRDAKLAAIDRPPRERSEVLVSKPEDVAFVGQLVAEVEAWRQAEDPSLELPAVNAYQRLLQYQELRRLGNAPGFYVERAANGDGRPALRLIRASPEQAAAWEAEQRQKRIEAIHDAAGFAAVMEAMRDSGKPMIGHNLAFDLAYSLHSFARELPSSWPEYKELVHRWFPGGVYDTKHLSGKLRPELFEDTSLGPLHDGLCKGQLQEQVDAFLRSQTAADTKASSDSMSDGEVAELPAVDHAPGFERYKGVDTEAYAHEAGFDAFMTGAVFACLLRLYEATSGATPAAGQQPDLAAVEDRCWRMHLSRSDLPYAALQGEDAEADRSHVFWISGWEASERVYGGELARRLADSGLGQLRGTSVDGGKGVLLEVADAEAVPGALDVMRKAFPTWTVQEYSAFAAYRAELRAAAAAAAAEERAAAAARRSNKRPRVEVEAAAPQAGGGSDSEGWMSRCSVM
ncbi:poly(A)-specific ribonuclease PARN isoform X3 [Chlorella sorokiniana]|uniref:Poly(A)-specific ribonuclease PARN isoform X3 n=1 Tax=Chlorella sorokiniana TaxID=3076 RepID=A0A2P6U4T2_CHLSO|nr:poly(A)-specific ribonuclease PARN isoform X3 [Chlorella sorokiniana]|eukprot:PRW61321.1 poly(A)-specific ribonuclease PARN isoform X3 [Chlorella sorokiniana]